MSMSFKFQRHSPGILRLYLICTDKTLLGEASAHHCTTHIWRHRPASSGWDECPAPALELTSTELRLATHHSWRNGSDNMSCWSSFTFFIASTCDSSSLWSSVSATRSMFSTRMHGASFPCCIIVWQRGRVAAIAARMLTWFLICFHLLVSAWPTSSRVFCEHQALKCQSDLKT